MQELPFLHSARRLMLIDICMNFREDSLRGFQVTERTRFVTDRETDRQTDGRTDRRRKTICLPTLKGGDLMKLELLLAKGGDSENDTNVLNLATFLTPTVNILL